MLRKFFALGSFLLSWSKNDGSLPRRLAGFSFASVIIISYFLFMIWFAHGGMHPSGSYQAVNRNAGETLLPTFWSIDPKAWLMLLGAVIGWQLGRGFGRMLSEESLALSTFFAHRLDNRFGTLRLFDSIDVRLFEKILSLICGFIVALTVAGFFVVQPDWAFFWATDSVRLWAPIAVDFGLMMALIAVVGTTLWAVVVVPLLVVALLIAGVDD